MSAIKSYLVKMRYPDHIMTEKFNWETFLDPYIQAVGELKIKLRGARKQYQKQNRHSPIEFVTGRVKPAESIKNKARFVDLRLKISQKCRILPVCA